METMALGPILVLVFMYFALMGLRVGTWLWMEHQAQTFLLCLADGMSHATCNYKYRHTGTQVAPWLESVRFSSRKHLHAIHVDLQFSWPEGIARWSPGPRTERIRVQTSSTWTKP
jgi:hypothetical protein